MQHIRGEQRQKREQSETRQEKRETKGGKIDEIIYTIVQSRRREMLSFFTSSPSLAGIHRSARKIHFHFHIRGYVASFFSSGGGRRMRLPRRHRLLNPTFSVDIITRRENSRLCGNPAPVRVVYTQFPTDLQFPSPSISASSNLGHGVDVQVDIVAEIVIPSRGEKERTNFFRTTIEY